MSGMYKYVTEDALFSGIAIGYMFACLKRFSKYKASSKVVFHWYFLRSVFQPLSVWMTVTPSLSRRSFCWS